MNQQLIQTPDLDNQSCCFSVSGPGFPFLLIIYFVSVRQTEGHQFSD